MSIYTLTPNPALDLSGIVDKIVPNEKNYVHDEIRCPGGNGINAARIINRLGIPVTVTGFLGGGVGEELKSFLDLENVRHQFIKIKSNTRISLTVFSLDTHLQTRLSFSGPQVESGEKQALLGYVSKIHKPTLLVIGGSLPSGFSSEDLVKVMKLCQRRNIATIVDCPGSILKGLITHKPLLIKPNLTEFQDLIGKRIYSIKSVLFEAQKLSKKVPLICVSSVEGGALLVTPHAAWFGRIPIVKIRSNVGAGDSMVGAMTAQLYRRNIFSREVLTNAFEKSHTKELLMWGLAAACATLIHPGTALGEATEIRKFYSKINVIEMQSR